MFGDTKETDFLYVYGEDGSLVWRKVASETLSRSLRRMDSDMPRLLGCGLLYACEKQRMTGKEFLNLICEQNPIDMDEAYYAYKLRMFLTACALGWDETKLWEGMEYAGDLVTMQQQGKWSVFCIDDREEFRRSLWEDTYIEVEAQPEVEGRDGLRIRWRLIGAEQKIHEEYMMNI